MINSLFKFLTKKRLNRIEFFKNNGPAVQENVLKKIIQKAKNTEWGRRYDYQSMRSIDDFRNRVPVSEYEDLYPFIERMMKGEQNVLWPTPIKWFGKSASTTSTRSKFIPVSRESLKEAHFKGGKDTIMLYMNKHPHTNIFKGRNLAVAGSVESTEPGSNIFYGDISAIIIKNLPLWTKVLNTLDADITLMKDWEKKVKELAHITCKKDVVTIAGVPSWTAVLLKKFLEIEGTNNIFDIWPNLELFIHGGVSFEPYRHLFAELTPNINYMEIYNATEGFFAIQDDLTRKNEMLLMLDYGIFYEFIPMDSINSLQAEVFKSDLNTKTITLDEVELHKNYAMVISTNGGLWRYLIGDTVKFSSLSPYRIKISGRTKHFINAFGEEVVVGNAERAVSEACSQTGAIISDFTAAPIFMTEGKGGAHEWLIEFKKEPESINAFTETLDVTLREVNSDYDAKRYNDMLLRPPVVRSVPQGTFYKWMEKRGKLGGQNKVPRLYNTREYVEEILKLTYGQ